MLYKGQFVVCMITRRVLLQKTKIGVTQDRSDTDKARTATRDNAHILPSILGFLSLSVMLVVKMSNSFTQRLDSCGRAVLTPSEGYIDGLWALEASLNIIFDLGGAFSSISTDELRGCSTEVYLVPD